MRAVVQVHARADPVHARYESRARRERIEHDALASRERTLELLVATTRVHDGRETDAAPNRARPRVVAIRT